MSKPWPLWRLIVTAILLVVPSFLVLIPTVLSPDVSRLVETSVGLNLDEVPEPEEGGYDMSWTLDSTDEQAIENQLKWQLGEDSTRSFDVVAEVRPDRSVLVTETITQVFRTERRGIERDIPYDYGDGGEHLIPFVDVATSEGTPDEVQVSDVGGAIRVRIGDPDIYISNAHTYRIQYAIENVVVERDGQAFVPLDAITDWAQDIDNLSYRLIGPADPVDFGCFAGSFGTDEGCDEIRLDDGGLIAFEEDLPAYQGFTVNAVYPLDAFDATALRVDRGKGWLWAVAGIGLMYLALILAYLRSVRRYKLDLADAVSGLSDTFAGKMALDLPGRRGHSGYMSSDIVEPSRADDVIPPPPPGAAGDLIPAQYADHDVPVEFVPPVNLDPACLLRVKEGVDADVRRMLAGTLVDLAADGVVGLERVGDDWLVRRIDQPPRMVKPYEYTLLEALLGHDRNEQLLSERVSDLSDKVKDYVKQVDAYLQDLGLLSASKMPATTKGGIPALARVFGITFVIVFTSIIAFGVSLVLPKHPASVMLLAAVIAGVVYFRDRIVNDGNSNRFTTRGRATALRARGFDRFFRESEAIHAQAAVRSGLMREYMGYAVALGSVDTWVAAMPAEQMQVWAGSGLADPYLLGSLYTQRIFARSVASTYSSSTSRGGGFSGGGFSGGGGGFGGGGGGSW